MVSVTVAGSAMGRHELSDARRELIADLLPRACLRGGPVCVVAAAGGITVRW